MGKLSLGVLIFHQASPILNPPPNAWVGSSLNLSIALSFNDFGTFVKTG